MTNKRKWDNYQFISRWELHVYSPRARLSPYLWRLICRCDWRSCLNWRGILDASRKFRREILGCAGHLIGCHNIPLRSDRDHDLVALSVLLGLNVDVSSFVLKLSFMILAATWIVVVVVLKNGLTRMSGIWWQTSILSTTKSTGTKEFLILIGIPSAIRTGHWIDWSTYCRCKEVGIKESWFS
jgi:hypothetical protein